MDNASLSTWVSTEVVTAAIMNTHVRDNFNETAPAKPTLSGQLFVSTGANAIAARAPAKDIVATSETTSSTSYTDLATSGPAVTTTTGSDAIVFLYARVKNGNSTASTFMSYAVSGATADSANDNRALINVGTDTIAATAFGFHEGLTAGSNTFTMKYRVSADTGTYQDRRLMVIPL